jgi:predicted metal-dependent hydrolase
MQMELSYHLMKSTPEFVDAVIVHELSHIFGIDHDSEFYRGFETHSSAEVVRIDREYIGYSNVYDI